MAFSCWGSCSGEFGQWTNGMAAGLCSNGNQVAFHTAGISSCGGCRARRDSFCERSASHGKANLTSGISRMRSATGGRFRGQAGRETREDYNLMMSQFSSMSFYEAGRQAAQSAFEAGGVNAMLAFLAGFNSD